MANPYQGQPDYCFWSRSVTRCPPGQLDPIASSPFRIDANTKVATMGSCFAQHIAKHIQKIGLNYLVTEAAPKSMPQEIAAAKNYGVFSARYGNLYTVRQALQLVQRSLGSFQPIDVAWPLGDRFCDPFRPTIEPNGFASPSEVAVAAAGHHAAVRQILSQSDLIVFTLGLTEGWRSRRDGAAYPLAPGVAGGTFDPVEHEAVNYTVGEIVEDLAELVRTIARMNPDTRLLLTVSPVPLIATHEDRHVVSSTAYSKSALRVAADQIERMFPNVHYFPSFEIITSPHNQGRYFEPDLRSVSSSGVAHVMRIFEKHYVEKARAKVEAAVVSGDADLVCDEQEIEAALSASGLK
jgi:hypothetical protein